MSLEATTLRNDWYRDRYSTVLRALLVVGLVALVEGAIIAGLLLNRPQPRYFAVSPDGTVIQMAPVDRPLLTPDALSRWASETATKAYALDFVHYREQMSALRVRFSDSAYKAYVGQMASSGNIEAITSKRLVMDAQASPATIVGSGIGTSGRYYWNVEVPLTVVTHVGGTSQRTQSMIVQMTIERVDNRFRPESGVVVNQFLVRLS